MSGPLAVLEIPWKYCTDQWYTSDKAEKDCEQVTCCVADPFDRTDDARCCNCVRASSSSTDMGFGHEGEREQRGAVGYRNVQTVRNANMFLAAQCVVFALFGAMLMLFPHETATTFLLSEDYLRDNRLSDEMTPEEREILQSLGAQDRAIAQQAESSDESLHRNAGLELVKSAIAKAMSVAASSVTGADPQKSEAERRFEEQERERIKLEAMRQLEVANKIEQRRLARQSPVHLTVTSFCRFYGAACLFFAAFSWNSRIEFAAGTPSVQGLFNAIKFLGNCIGWYAAGVAAMILSAVDKAGGSESTSYMTVSIVCYFLAMFFVNRQRSALAGVGAHVSRSIASKRGTHNRLLAQDLESGDYLHFGEGGPTEVQARFQKNAAEVFGEDSDAGFSSEEE